MTYNEAINHADELSDFLRGFEMVWYKNLHTTSELGYKLQGTLEELSDILHYLNYDKPLSELCKADL